MLSLDVEPGSHKMCVSISPLELKFPKKPFFPFLIGSLGYDSRCHFGEGEENFFN